MARQDVQGGGQDHHRGKQRQGGRGRAPARQPELSEDFEQILAWADELRTLGVRANADIPEDTHKAREFGAGGIGLCRTEHMYTEESRLVVAGA